jgi:hypothetical protein
LTLFCVLLGQWLFLIIHDVELSHEAESETSGCWKGKQSENHRDPECSVASKLGQEFPILHIDGVHEPDEDGDDTDLPQQQTHPHESLHSVVKSRYETEEWVDVAHVALNGHPRTGSEVELICEVLVVV